MPGTASGWMPYVTALQASGASVDSFAAHDDSSGFAPLCGDDLRRRPSARLWRVFSNQYFLPLLLLNPHHAPLIEAMGREGAPAREGTAARPDGGADPDGEVAAAAAPGGRRLGAARGAAALGTAGGWRRRSGAAKRGGRGGRGRPGAAGGGGGLWGPALRALLRPQPRLLGAASAFLSRSGLQGKAVLGLHARSTFEAAPQRERLLGCARARLRALNATDLFLATMARRTRAQARAAAPLAPRRD